MTEARDCTASQDESKLQFGGLPVEETSDTNVALYRRDSTSRYYEDHFNGYLTHQVYFHANGVATLANGPQVLAGFIFKFAFKDGTKPWYTIVTGKDSCDLKVPHLNINNIDYVETIQAAVIGS